MQTNTPAYMSRCVIESYNTPYSKQCFIMSKENNAIFFRTLQDWGVGDNTTIKGTVYETDRRDK